MFRKEFAGSALSAILLSVGMPAFAGWGFNGAPFPNAFNQAGDMTLELACDRMRFTPAGYEDARDIERKQGLSICFKKDEAREAGVRRQARQDNERTTSEVCNCDRRSGCLAAVGQHPGSHPASRGSGRKGNYGPAGLCKQ